METDNKMHPERIKNPVERPEEITPLRQAELDASATLLKTMKPPVAKAKKPRFGKAPVASSVTLPNFIAEALRGKSWTKFIKVKGAKGSREVVDHDSIFGHV